ncbi:MAG: hypothetical protein WD605_01525 [Candidatus Paceibacterota bacterium]
MLKTTTYKSPTAILIGFVLAALFALVFVPTANAQIPFDVAGSNLSSEQKEQMKQRLQEAQMRINELREKNKATVNELADQQKAQMKELREKNRAQLEELRTKAEERIKKLRAEASLRADNGSANSLDANRGNAISEAAKQMRSGERSALFGAIIERLQKIDAERGDNNPLLKAAIEQLQKLRSQLGDETEDEEEDEEEDDEDEDEVEEEVE